jgi:cytochrome P450
VTETIPSVDSLEDLKKERSSRVIAAETGCHGGAGAGARSCIGDHYAMLEATLGLASLVRRRRFTSLDPDFPLALPFTMTAGGPILARVETR